MESAWDLSLNKHELESQPLPLAMWNRGKATLLLGFPVPQL